MRFLAERATGSLSEFRKLDQMEPCRNCTHQQGSHDEDDHCTLCPCREFQYVVTE